MPVNELLRAGSLVESKAGSSGSRSFRCKDYMGRQQEKHWWLAVLVNPRGGPRMPGGRGFSLPPLLSEAAPIRAPFRRPLTPESLVAP